MKHRGRRPKAAKTDKELLSMVSYKTLCLLRYSVARNGVARESRALREIYNLIEGWEPYQKDMDNLQKMLTELVTEMETANG